MKQKIVHIITWTLLLGVFVALVGFVDYSRKAMPGSDLVISINDEQGVYFVSEDLVRDKLSFSGDTIIGQPYAQIDINWLEESILNIPEVEDAQVYKTIDGKVFINVKQRRPIARVFMQTGESFYLDDKGKVMPLSEHYSARVLPFTGNIHRKTGLYNLDEIASDDSLSVYSILPDIYEIASFVNKHEFWRSQVEQIYVSHQGEYELIPRVGHHRILLGDANGIERKFENLFHFYKKGLNALGWNKYDTINLKYKNQIVCTKK